ncbi:diacylglycerol kinase zeta-like [Cydia splendana]|uniref:diacylglycerol kinase zeta-like n=1 Tax=Cydia splendana TaxID=1100963 RepID=UPI00300C9E34
MLSWGTGRASGGGSKARPPAPSAVPRASDEESDSDAGAEGALLAGAAALARRRHAIRIKRKSKIAFRVLRRTGEEAGGARVLRTTPDWGEGAVSGEHLWMASTVSGESCYLGEAECQRSTLDWDEDAVSGEHLWMASTVSGESCYLGEAECQRSTLDWGEGAVSGEYLWMASTVSGKSCYLGEAECQVRHTF